MAKLKLQSGVLVVSFQTEPSGPFASITGTCRPATPQEVADHDAQMALASSPAARVAAKNAFYAKHIQSWDVETESGTIAEITPANINSLPYPVWAQLEKVVLGFSVGEWLGN